MRHAAKLRPALAGLALLAGLAAGVRAPHAATAPDDAPDPAAIKQIIADQIEAFRHDDAPAAFHDAAPSIQHRFGDPAHFMAMVRQGYAPVYHPQSYRFGTLSTDGGAIVQRVELIGPDGRAAVALYSLEREPDGSWRISGCALIAADDPAV